MRGQGLKMKWDAQEGQFQKLVVVWGWKGKASGGVCDRWPSDSVGSSGYNGSGAERALCQRTRNGE